MSFQKNKSSEENNWSRFKNMYSGLFFKSGLQETVTLTEEHFVDFLMHGYLDHHEDPFQFSSNSFTNEQYDAFKELVYYYISESHAVFSVLALKTEDYIQLNKKYDPNYNT